MYEFSKHPRGEQEARELDDRAIFCYFRLKLTADTLKHDFTDKQCTFLVNLMTDNSKTNVSYEQFLNFIIPRTKKSITPVLISKIKQTDLPLENGRPAKCNYDAICALGKLFECEVQIMKKIQRQIAKFQGRNSEKTLDLQIANLY